MLFDPQLLQEQAFPYGFARCKELGFELLRILCEIAPLRKDALDFLHHSERLLPIFTFVDEHMHESISVADLAESVGFINPFHFSRAFKEVVGMSPSYYRKQLQEEQAVVSP